MSTVMLRRLPSKDATARAVADMPHWAQGFRNGDIVETDTRGVAHKPESLCWDTVRCDGNTTLVKALVDGKLCGRCGS